MKYVWFKKLPEIIHPTKKTLMFLKHSLIYILMKQYFAISKLRYDFHYKLLHVECGSEK